MLCALANIIWLILGGLILGLLWTILGLLLCITIIGIPFGLQCFKFATLCMAPFGKNVTIYFGKHPLINLIWFFLFGWEMFIVYLCTAIAQCITIIGIPNGLQSLKMASLALFPFGAEVK